MPAAPLIRHTRVKKLSKATFQQILLEEEVEDYDSASLGHEIKDSGVEPSEQEEIHLQAALNASNGQSEGDIPAPPAEESADIDYDSLYPLKFSKTATYIRFSQTVEECTGCQYDMSSVDEEFLTEYNKTHSGSAISDDVFEQVMFVFEDTAETHAPYAAVDQTVIPFDTMLQPLKQQAEEIPQTIAKDFYEYWKKRRQENGNSSIQPQLKFETHQDNDDGDPYVCFRRREVRQTRKTRARDVQSNEKLKRLRKELEEGRSIVQMVLSRELAKRELSKNDKDIFEARSELKAIKLKTGIKIGDEELLVNQKPQKKRPLEVPSLSRLPGSQPRVPPRADGRMIDADLVQLKDILRQKENLLQIEIQEKSKQHEIWNSGFEDLTRDPLSPVRHGSRTGFRPATAQYQLLTPPSSVTSESFDRTSPGPDKVQGEKHEPFVLEYHSESEDDDSLSQPAYRKRIGRCGRLWIDRRGLPSGSRNTDHRVLDRWKYDQDDDDDQPVYEVDPYDINALRFRASIPLPQHLIPQRMLQQGRINGPSPPNNRSAVAQSAPAPT